MKLGHCWVAWQRSKMATRRIRQYGRTGVPQLIRPCAMRWIRDYPWITEPENHSEQDRNAKEKTEARCAQTHRIANEPPRHPAFERQSSEDATGVPPPVVNSSAKSQLICSIGITAPDGGLRTPAPPSDSPLKRTADLHAPPPRAFELDLNAAILAKKEIRNGRG